MTANERAAWERLLANAVRKRRAYCMPLPHAPRLQLRLILLQLRS